jgi:hypothetical protein
MSEETRTGKIKIVEFHGEQKILFGGSLGRYFILAPIERNPVIPLMPDIPVMTLDRLRELGQAILNFCKEEIKNPSI